MTRQTNYLKNTWYIAALATEVKGIELFTRKILGISVLMFRKQDGSAVALHNRCPHRFAPLHLGVRTGDEVACLYHGLRFNSEGVCTHNPHGTQRIPSKACVKNFPLEERYGFLWIWMGENPAQISLLPDYSELDRGHTNGVAYTHMKLNVNYQLIIDNVMDLSHIDHIHGDIISTRGQLSPVVPAIKEINNTISARWEWTQKPAMLIFADFMPDPEGEARGFFEITWSQPANIQLSVGAVQGDNDFGEGAGQYDLHVATPEDEFTSHYYFATRRDHNVEDAEYNDIKIKAMHAAFEDEDGPILHAVQQEMGSDDFFELNPVLMSNDVAPVKVRRLLSKLIDQELHNREGSVDIIASNLV